jgi:adenosylhomocysteine nucleosidase
MVNAAIVTTLLADRFGCRPIVFSGVTGGLDPSLAMDDVVIAEKSSSMTEACSRRSWCSPINRPRAFINPTDRMRYPTDPDLVRVKARLRDTALSGQIAGGTVLSGDQDLNCGSTRHRRDSRSHS